MINKFVPLEKEFISPSDYGKLFKVLTNGGIFKVGKYALMLSHIPGEMYKELCLGVVGDGMDKKVFFNMTNTFVKKEKPKVEEIIIDVEKLQEEELF